MLNELFAALSELHSGFGVFRYITLRAVCGVLTALLITLAIGPEAIRRLRRFGEVVREDGPQSHHAKAGTPTMGRSPDPVRGLSRPPCCGPISPTVSYGWCSR